MTFSQVRQYVTRLLRASFTNKTQLDKIGEDSNGNFTYNGSALGGMPDIMANKFSRADLYSTDEKMIGRWIDGKPLYQKTWTGLNIELQANTWYDTQIDATSLVPINGFARCDNTSDNFVFFPYIRNSNNTLRLTNAVRVGIITTLTVQYTKTTDSSVEIGSDTDYSTTEKIVGTWIDGKPIYQKTITGLNWAFSWENQQYNARIKNKDLTQYISNPEKIIGSFGMYSTNTVCSLIIDGNSLSNVSIKSFVSGTLKMMTLQYTKTTD